MLFQDINPRLSLETNLQSDLKEDVFSSPPDRPSNVQFFLPQTALKEPTKSQLKLLGLSIRNSPCLLSGFQRPPWKIVTMNLFLTTFQWFHRNLNVERGVPGVRPILCCMTGWVETTPLRYDNELDNELEFIPNTEKISHTCVMCSCQKSLNLAMFKRQGGQTVTLMFFHLHNWNSTNVTSRSCRTEERNNPDKFCAAADKSQGQVEGLSCVVFEPWGY